MKTINDYAELVKEKHALNKTIAPVETDLTDASRGYHIGEQFIYDAELYKAKTEIAQHDALVLNTNYEPSDNLTEQIKNAGGGTGTDPRLDVFENNIAPVETDETDASKAYQVGEQLILNNILYDVIAAISEHDVITTTGSGANIAPADPISLQVEDLTNKVGNLTDYVSETGVKNILPLTLDEIKKANPIVSWSGNVGTTAGIAFTVVTENEVVTGIKANGTSTGEANFNITNRNTNIWRPAFNTVTLSGSPSGSTSDCCMKANKTTSSGALYIGEIYESGRTITLESTDIALGFWISIQSGQTVTDKMFYPQIEEGTTKSAFQPYAKTNQELTAENQTLTNNLSDEVETKAKLGAHNLCPISIATQTFRGVTYTVNADGTITVSGTVTAGQDNANINIAETDISAYIGKTLKFSGGDNLSSSLYFYFDIMDSSNARIKRNVVDNTAPLVEYIVPSNAKYARVSIITPSTFSGTATILYPMIRLASDSSTAYAPYAMTNRELTENKTGYIDPTQTTTIVNGTSFTDSTEYTIPSDGWYMLYTQIDTQHSGKTLAIYKNSVVDGNMLASVRTTGTQYQHAVCVVPLKAGTKIVFKYGDSSIACSYRIYKTG